MTKDEFHLWKSTPETKEVFENIKNAIHSIEYNLAREAGEDQKSDRYKAGMIKGLELVLNIELEDESDQS